VTEATEDAVPHGDTPGDALSELGVLPAPMGGLASRCGKRLDTPV
jgi:hypothetical protein